MVLAFGGYFYWDDLILVSGPALGPVVALVPVRRPRRPRRDARCLVAGAIIRGTPGVDRISAIGLVVLQLPESLALLRVV